MATIKSIIEKIRNPLDNSWIKLREIELNETEDGGVATSIRLLDENGEPLTVEAPLALVDGMFVTQKDGGLIPSYSEEEKETSLMVNESGELVWAPHVQIITWPKD